LKQILQFIALAAIWGSSFLFMRLAAPEFGSVVTAWLRVGIAALALMAGVLLMGKWPGFKVYGLRAMGIGIINSAIPFVLYSWSAQVASAGFNSIVNATTMLWTALISLMFFHGSISKKGWLGLAIGFAGIVMLFADRAGALPGKTGQDLVWAGAAGLLATFCYGIAANVSKKYLAGAPALVSAAGSQLGAALVLLPLAVWMFPTQKVSATAWGAVLVLGLACSALAYILYFDLIARWGAYRSSSITYLVPVFGVLWGWLFVNETLGIGMLLAMIAIVFGTALSNKK
jgi:drug/metabolite transporter (DMT)-like permease